MRCVRLDAYDSVTRYPEFFSDARGKTVLTWINVNGAGAKRVKNWLLHPDRCKNMREPLPGVPKTLSDTPCPLTSPRRDRLVFSEFPVWERERILATH